MRLIDANALIEEMRKTEEECENAMTCPSWWSALSVIEKQPTAYNVEKVVEGLEEIKGQGCVGVKCKDCKYTHNCFEGERAENVVIDKAIEIIRRGGVE